VEFVVAVERRFLLHTRLPHQRQRQRQQLRRLLQLPLREL
jgi:hypothetical protein